jgi:diguanylate cyclase (GGDEF)-like protein/PAS domain S-box-containing protein
MEKAQSFQQSNVEFHHRIKDGSIRNVEVFSSQIEIGEKTFLYSIVHDITQRKQAENALRQSEARFRSYFELPLIGLAITSPSTVWIDANTTLCAMLGYTKAELLQKTWTQITHPDDLALDLAQFKRVIAGEIEGYVLEKRFICKQGRSLYTNLAVSCSRHPDRSVDYFFALVQDITERKRLQEQLHQYATTDELTGLFNRRHFLDLAQRELKRAMRLNNPLALAMIDVDHFKWINDTYGHAMGDQALVVFKEVCQKNIREVDILSRWGGDEFVVLLPEANGQQAYEVVERVRLTLATTPLHQDNPPFSLTMSAGISSLTREIESLDVLLGRADHALYQAKKQGRNCVIIEHDLG